MSPTWKKNVYTLISIESSTVVHELEPAHGGQTACEGLVDKTNYRKADWDCSALFHTRQIQGLKCE